MDSEVSGSRGKHVLVLPYPAQGHMLPMLDFAGQLARRGLMVTILVTPKNLQTLEPLLSTHQGIQTLVLPFPGHPQIPVGVENVKDIGIRGNPWMIYAMRKLYEPIAKWFESQEEEHRPEAIISDFFMGWTEKLGSELSVPRIVFYSSGAFLTTIIHNSWKRTDNVLSLDVVEFAEVPGKPVFRRAQLPTIIRAYKKSDPEFEFLKESCLLNFSSWGSVFNSFSDLEGRYIQHLSKIQRVWAVGPLKLLTEPGKSNPESSSDILRWLEECPEGSVVYICFGSQKMLSRKQMEGLAAGLERGGTRFLWVVKQGTTGDQVEEGFGLVPEGFEERVGERGLIVKSWVPQDAVLSHKAVAYFLSHCGWNSVLEAVAAGVGILAWPMEADQFVNAKLLVEDMRVAAIVCEGADTVPDADKLSRTIAEAMTGDKALRSKMKELSGKACEAVKPGGSSARDLDQLVEELTLLQVNKN